MTTDGKNEPYEHGFRDYTIGSLDFVETDSATEPEEYDVDFGDYVVYSSEEIEEYLDKISEDD